jgi:hypothetical protein
MKRTYVLVAVAIAGLAVAAAAGAMHLSAWSTAQKIDEVGGNSTELNTPFLDGCPIQSPDGLSLYMASNRPNGHGGLDIWVARRPSTGAPFGAPENLPEPINSAADDFCPTPVRGHGLFFVSRRTTAESCGLGDIYFARLSPAHGWRDPLHLSCAPAGPNSELDEQGPSYVSAAGGQLYFSRSSATMLGDVYVSDAVGKHVFGPASAVAELNSPGNELQPNVRKDGREIVFSSNRSGSAGQDIWFATRDDLAAPWSAPELLGGAVNTAASETRPSLSWDGEQLLFGRTPGPEGMSDIYVSTRSKVHGKP